MNRGFLIRLSPRRLAVALLAILLALGLYAPAALAAPNPAANPTGALDLVTSPLPISLATKPGTTISTDIRVRNAGTAPETLKTTVLTFGAQGDAGTPQLLNPTPADEFIHWASFSPSTFTAQPNEWVTVHMTIRVPTSAAFGYYYAVVFSRANGNGPNAPNQANLSGAVAVLVLLEAQVPGAKRSVQVVDFSSDHGIYEFLPASFTVHLHNDGNVHVAPRGNIFIMQGNKTIDILEVNFAKGNILPGTNRIFTSSWANGYPAFQPKISGGKVVLDSNDHPESTLNWGGYNLSKLRFGHYTAHMVLAYDNGTRDVPIEAVVGFWVVPWRIIGVLLVVGLLAGTGLWTTGKSLRQRIFRRRRRK